MNNVLIDRLLNDPPKFHYWEGEARIGGMGPMQLQSLVDFIPNVTDGEVPIAIETGAGLSTVWLLAHGYCVYSFVADAAVGERITTFLTDYPELAKNWHLTIGYSEETLPKILYEKRPDAQLCLIDGGHGIQTVFVDFVYLNYFLVKGGALFVDDIQIGAPRLLLQVLEQDKGFKAEVSTSKTARLTKVTSDRLLPDWGAQKDILDKIGHALN